MNFNLPCSCGNEVVVTEGSAGAIVTCSCGRKIDVPGLKELRQQQGLTPYDASPELLLERLRDDGELTAGKQCIECGVVTSNVLEVQADCEQGWERGSDGFDWSTFFVSFLLFRLLFFRWGRGSRQLAHAKAYILPLGVCAVCEGRLTRPAQLKEAARKIPLYQRLLDKFPEARVFRVEYRRAPS